MYNIVRNSQKRFLYTILVLFFALFPTIAKANSYSKYVGQGFGVPLPTCPVSNGYVNSYSFSCSNANVTVDQNGWVTITGYFSGTATIECYFQYMYLVNNKYWYTGTRSEYHQVSCLSNNISISAPKSELNVGETMQLTYRFSTSTYSVTPSITWESNSSAVAVNKYTGYVEARSPGTATITARSNLGSNEATCYVSVIKVDPTRVSIPDEVTTYVGESTSLSLQLYPSNAITSYTWYCSPTSVASVSGGTVSGKGEGTATVYCRTDNGVRSNDCTVNVKYRKATGVNVSKSTLSLPIGKSSTLTWTPVPSNAKTSVTWKSSDTSVATVTQSGQVLGVKAGQANITVTTDNGYSATCVVTVPPNASSISIPSTIDVTLGSKATIPVTVTPTDAYYTLTWNNSSPSIASLNGTEVTPLSEGSTKISCIANNGVSSNVCTVKVTYPLPTSVTTSKSEIFLPIGSTEKLTYSFSPSIAKSSMTWKVESGGEKIVSVTSTGTVRALSAGNAKVVAKTSNGLTVTYKVTVPHDPESITLSLRRVSLWVGDSRSITVKASPEDAYFTGKWVSSNPTVAFVTQAGDVFALSPGSADILYITNKGLTSVTKIEVPDNDLALHVWDVNGNQYTYSTNKHTVITYSNGKLSFNVAGNVQTYDARQIHKITMLEDGSQPIPSKIVIPPNLEMNSGDRKRLAYTLYPFEYDIQTTISWSSSNEAVASVDNEGRITAKTAGEAIITVKAGNGKKSECRVKVNKLTCYYTVILRNGNRFGYEIAETPKMTYRNGNLVFTTATSVKEYPADDVWKICLVDPGVIAYVGDINEDGKVSIGDVATLIQMFIDQRNNNMNSDVNSDGIVDFKDINELSNKILKKK